MTVPPWHVLLHDLESTGAKHFGGEDGGGGGGEGGVQSGESVADQ